MLYDYDMFPIFFNVEAVLVQGRTVHAICNKYAACKIMFAANLQSLKLRTI